MNKILVILCFIKIFHALNSLSTVGKIHLPLKTRTKIRFFLQFSALFTLYIYFLKHFFAKINKFAIKTATMSRYIDIHTHHFTSRHIELRAVGIHPWDAENATIDKAIFCGAEAIGEIGLDYACKVSRERQAEIFRTQLAIAERMGLPVVLHCVRAFAPMMAILSEYKLNTVIFHGFIGSREQALEVAKRGYFLSFGERTFRSPKTIEALRNTPLENLFLETDESATPIEEIYAMAAEIRGEKLEIIINGIINNYNRLFQL